MNTWCFFLAEKSGISPYPFAEKRVTHPLTFVSPKLARFSVIPPYIPLCPLLGIVAAGHRTILFSFNIFLIETWLLLFLPLSYCMFVFVYCLLQSSKSNKVTGKFRQRRVNKHLMVSCTVCLAVEGISCVSAAQRRSTEQS
jgi:hypothetical protein